MFFTFEFAGSRAFEKCLICCNLRSFEMNIGFFYKFAIYLHIISKNVSNAIDLFHKLIGKIGLSKINN